MCGIAGFIDLSRRCDNPSDLIENMLDCIRHRGPDDWGKWSSNNNVVTLGHRRLSILDTSESGRQPFESPSGRYVLTYNGEVYNFKDIRDELGDIELGSTGDTAVVAAAFDRWGIRAAIEKFNGMFAIGVWDHQQQEFVLVRDRLGKKPAYYGRVNGVFAFASELKPLHSIEGFCDEICPYALEELIKYGYIAAPRSIFKSVFKLRAGELLRLDCKRENQAWQLEKYWSPSQSSPDSIPDSTAEYLEMIEELLIDSVKIRMISDVPLGAFLSGGIDSSLVCALMAKVASGPVKTFSIGFHESGFDEAVFAKKVAAHLKTDHHEKYLTGKDSLDLIEKIPDVYTEPFADSSQVPTYLVSQFARENVTVALSGDGGDELFSGYRRFGEVLSGWKSKNSPTGKAITAGLNIAGKIAPGLTSKAIITAAGRKSGKWGGQKVFRRELERRNAKHFSDYYQLNNSAYAMADSLLADEFRGSVNPTQVPDWDEFGSEQVRMSTHDIRYFLPEDILTKVDRASMAVSLETRNPILDYRLVGPSLAGLDKFPESSNPKWAIKSILAKYVPSEYFERPKQGFGIPLQQWMANEMRPWIEEMISEDRILKDGFFDAERVTKAWQEFLEGDKLAWGVILWRLVIFQAWHEKFYSKTQLETAVS